MMPCVLLLEAEERKLTDEEWMILLYEAVRVRALLNRLEAALAKGR